MKRVIRFYQEFKDGVSFSDCGTQYEILPILVDDEAGNEILQEIAEKLNIELMDKFEIETPKYVSSLFITHAFSINSDKTARCGWGDPEKVQEYIGLITLNDGGTLNPLEGIDNPIDAETADVIVNYQEYGVDDVGEHNDGGNVLVKNGWDFYHHIPLLGYSMESFLEVLEVKETGFYDDTYRCSECGIYDDRDNGYVHNHRETDDGLVGINCGCYDTYCENNLDEYANNSDKPIELELAQKLAENDQIEFKQRFIGGMTDGRGGYWHGSDEGSGYCEEGDPASVLEEYQEKNPDKNYVFSMDECGQFQTYFSIWEIK